MVKKLKNVRSNEVRRTMRGNTIKIGRIGAVYEGKGFVWVWNLVADIAGGKEAEGV